jgi:hypothetical protein
MRRNIKWTAELGREFAGTRIGIGNNIYVREEDEIAQCESGGSAMAIGLNCGVLICSDNRLLGCLDCGVDVLNKIGGGGVECRSQSRRGTSRFGTISEKKGRKCCRAVGCRIIRKIPSRPERGPNWNDCD